MKGRQIGVLSFFANLFKIRRTRRVRASVSDALPRVLACEKRQIPDTNERHPTEWHFSLLTHMGKTGVRVERLPSNFCKKY